MGRWQDVLKGVSCDSLICDAPYSERTHKGSEPQSHIRDPIKYACWGEYEIVEFVESWLPRTRGWFVSITDHFLYPVWERQLAARGLYVFSPIAVVETGSRVRLQGDGPSQWSSWMVVARPRGEPYSKWGTLPGAYIAKAQDKPVMGGKHLGLMRAIVRDYTRPGDLVCDPCAGGGTTLLAALSEGRRAVGAEMDPEHYEIAKKRLAAGYTPPLFTGEDI